MARTKKGGKAMKPYGMFLVNFTHVVGDQYWSRDGRKVVVDLALQSVILRVIRERWGY